MLSVAHVPSEKNTELDLHALDRMRENKGEDELTGAVVM
jgi:hypothetical protein